MSAVLGSRLMVANTNSGCGIVLTLRNCSKLMNINKG